MPKAKKDDGATSSKKPAKEKKDKPVKDPNAPKKAKTAYQFFSNAENRQQMKAELGEDATFGEVSKALGARWKEMSPEDKEPFQTQAEADKKRFAKEQDIYKASQPV